MGFQLMMLLLAYGGFAVGVNEKKPIQRSAPFPHLVTILKLQTAVINCYAVHESCVELENLKYSPSVPHSTNNYHLYVQTLRAVESIMKTNKENQDWLIQMADKIDAFDFLIKASPECADSELPKIEGENLMSQAAELNGAHIRFLLNKSYDASQYYDLNSKYKNALALQCRYSVDYDLNKAIKMVEKLREKLPVTLQFLQHRLVNHNSHERKGTSRTERSTPTSKVCPPLEDIIIIQKAVLICYAETKPCQESLKMQWQTKFDPSFGDCEAEYKLYMQAVDATELMEKKNREIENTKGYYQWRLHMKKNKVSLSEILQTTPKLESSVRSGNTTRTTAFNSRKQSLLASKLNGALIGFLLNKEDSSAQYIKLQKYLIKAIHSRNKVYNADLDMAIQALLNLRNWKRGNRVIDGRANRELDEAEKLTRILTQRHASARSSCGMSSPKNYFGSAAAIRVLTDLKR
eukprot:Lankesteria_metandrocarpae@DN2798_c0_g1_i1.p1